MKHFLWEYILRYYFTFPEGFLERGWGVKTSHLVVIEMRNHLIKSLKVACLHLFPTVTVKDIDKSDNAPKFFAF